MFRKQEQVTSKASPFASRVRMVLMNHLEMWAGEETEEGQSWPRAASASGVRPVP